MTKTSDDPSTATAAYLRGLRENTNDLFWLKRARRLAPDDPRIELEIARRELSAGPQGVKLAYKAFQDLAQRYDIAPVWIGLAISAQMQGDAAGAAKAVETLLHRHCLPNDPSFPIFARHVAIAAGYDGYQGYTADGKLVSEGAGRLLGAHPDLAALSCLEGLVEWQKDGLTGWAVRLAWPDQPPHLTLTDAEGHSLIVRCGKPLRVDNASPFLPRYRFRIAPSKIDSFLPPYILSGSDGRQLLGSPIDPRPLQLPSGPANMRGSPLSVTPKHAPLVLVMPAYRGLNETQAAINSVLKALKPDTRFIVVNDASPEPSLVRWLETLSQKRKIELIQHTKSLGFCASANAGLEAAQGCDVLLLNSDILFPPKTIETLRQVAYTSPAIGTVTPLSNEAAICSYPDPNGGNSMPDLATTCLFASLARKVNGLSKVEIPTGVGFCLYIRHDCLSATGDFRTEIFAQGYGEENDFCLRARHLGYTHVAAMGAYVAHKGGVSFRSATRALSSRNLAILNRLYPGYQSMVTAHIAEDPTAPYRAALDEARLCFQQKGQQSVLMISHAHGGGVAKQVNQTALELRAQGLAPLLLTTKFPRDSTRTRYPWPSLLCAGNPKDYPNLTFTLPEKLPQLLSLLRQLKTSRVELHHMLGQHESVRGIASALGIPQDIIAHDYASFCPRVNLLTRPDRYSLLRYCGEPDVSGCIKCCQQDKEGIFETLPVRQLIARSKTEFAAARRVIVPSTDMARRLSRHFPGITPQVVPWQDDSHPVTLRKPRQGMRRIAIIGGIGPSKGFDVLLDCAQDIQRRKLPLELIVIGSSADDRPLLEAGIKVTGAYRTETAEQLIADLAPDLAFIPSICPETWCFVLGEAWQAGLYTVVFDLGAQAERVRATGRGGVLPLGLSPERINNALSNIMF